MFFNDGNITEDLLKTVPVYGENRGEGIFRSFLETNVHICKLVSVTSDGAPDVTTENTMA
jgi:hypothetical protein